MRKATLRLSAILLVVSLLGCGAATPTPATAPSSVASSPAPAAAAPAAPKAAEPDAAAEGSDAEAPAEEVEPTYPASSAPKDIGKVNGKPVVIAHAYIARPEGTFRLQAFEYLDVAASVVCPGGLRFISKGMMLQIDFLHALTMEDVSRVYVQHDKPGVKVTKGTAKLLAQPKPGEKVGVEVDLHGPNGTRFKGVIEAVVCHPPKEQPAE
jgi:hypothetical protein